MSGLLDEALKEKYRMNAINDPLAFAKDAIDWSAFPSLLKDPYHNDTDRGGRPNIPIITMVKVLFRPSVFNIADEQGETLIRDRISFMNLLDYPDLLPRGNGSKLNGRSGSLLFRRKCTKINRRLQRSHSRS